MAGRSVGRLKIKVSACQRCKMGVNGHVKRGELKNRVAAYLAKNPDAKPTAIAKAVGGSKTYVGRVVKERKCKHPIHKLSQLQKLPLTITLDVSECDAEVKLLSRARVVGTLRVGELGVEYKKANAKKSSGRRLSWAVLEKLMTLGIE